jgi:hypothetical protein
MTEWLEPGTWESIAKTAATSIGALAKLRAALARRKKTTRKLDEEVDALRKDLEQLVGLMLKQATSHGRFLDSLVRALKAVSELDLVGRAGQFGTIVKTHGDAILALGSATTGLHDAALKHENRLKVVERALSTEDAGAKTQRRRAPRRVTRRK